MPIRCIHVKWYSDNIKISRECNESAGLPGWVTLACCSSFICRLSRPRHLLLYDGRADRSVVAGLDTLEAAGAAIAFHDLRMFVYQYVDLPENILRTFFEALPTGFALPRVKAYVFRSIFADHCLLPCLSLRQALTILPLREMRWMSPKMTRSQPSLS